MTMDGVNYAHNQWHVLEKGTPFYEYIFDLIDKDYVNPLEQMSRFLICRGVMIQECVTGVTEFQSLCEARLPCDKGRRYKIR